MLANRNAAGALAPVLFLLSVGCSVQSDEQSAASVAEVLVVDRSADGTTVTIVEGTDLVVRLPSNRTTGYDWIASGYPRAFSAPEVTFEMGDRAIGAGGTSVMVWHTTSPIDSLVGGPYPFMFEYRRSWEQDVEPADRFSFDLVVVAAESSDDLVIDESGNGGSFTVVDGGDIVVRLPSNPTTGYDWIASRYARAFSAPEVTFEAGEQAIGSGGTTVVTWHSTSPLESLVGGPYSFALEYRRPWEEDVDAADTFSFEVTVVSVEPQWCEAGTVVDGPSTFVEAEDGKECAVPVVHCVTDDFGACPLLSPLNPDWCADGTVVPGDPSFITSADGMECRMPSVHCVTKDFGACPLLSLPPPDWCSDGTIVHGSARFISSADGKECQMPSIHCVSNDCPAR